MKLFKSLAVVAALAAAFAGSAQAQVRITEVAPWASGNSASTSRADWFELTNIGSSVVDITGWKMDDDSVSFASSVALLGITSIAAGQSVIFIEGTSVQSAAFINNWFGGSAPSGFAIGTYSGSGVGLSAGTGGTGGTGGDGVAIFNAAGVLQAQVSVPASPNVSPFATFDNAAGLNGSGLSGTVSTLSSVGVNGAFQVVHGAVTEIGSPGSIAAVPEPETYAMLLAGLALIGGIARRRKAA